MRRRSGCGSCARILPPAMSRLMDLPALVAARVGAVALDVLLQQLELALLRVLRELPAVVRGPLGAGTALALQVREQVALDAAADVRRGADEEKSLAAPQD